MLGVRRRAPAGPSAKHLLRRSAAKLRRLGRDEGGNIVILAGALMPALLAGMGLGAETGYWYWIQRKVQHAADVSVYAAAVRMGQGDSETAYEAVALHVAEEAGYTGGTGKIEVHSPPQAPSAFAGQADHVQVILTEPVPRLLSSLFIKSDLTLTGQAVASVEYGSSGCVLAMSKTKAKAITLTGDTEVELKGCDIASNSIKDDSFYMQGGSAKLTTGCVHSAGGVHVSHRTNLKLTDELSGDGPCANGPRDHGPSIADPYATVPDPQLEGVACDPNKMTVAPPQTRTFTPPGTHSSGMKSMCFGKGLELKGTVTFEPGVYFIKGGDFSISSTAVVDCACDPSKPDGVTFVLLGGASLSFNGGATINLSAPKPDPANPTNPFVGILFFSDRGDTTAIHTINGNASSKFTGAVYAPTTQVKYAGGGSTTGACTQIIGDTVEFTGSSNVGSDCTGTGVHDMKFGQQIAIVE